MVKKITETEMAADWQRWERQIARIQLQEISNELKEARCTHEGMPKAVKIRLVRYKLRDAHPKWNIPWDEAVDEIRDISTSLFLGDMSPKKSTSQEAV